MVCMGKHTFANCYRMQVFSFHGVIEYSELGGTHTRITESHSYFCVFFSMFNLVNYVHLKRDKSACGIVESIAL